MPTLLGSLRSEGIRNLAQNLFSGFYERGLSASAALKELQEIGLGYRRTDFLSDYASGQSSFSQAVKIRFVKESNVPSESILQPKYFGTPDRYSMVYKYTGSDITTGEERSGYFFYHRNSLDTKANMEHEAGEWLTSQAEKYGVDVESIRLVEGYINPVWQ